MTAAAGLAGAGNDYGMGVAVGDYDNDGFADLTSRAMGGTRCIVTAAMELSPM